MPSCFAVATVCGAGKPETGAMSGGTHTVTGEEGEPEVVCRACITGSCGCPVQAGPLRIISGNAIPFVIQHAKISLGIAVPARRGRLEPAHRLDTVAPNTGPISVA
jgi:hypothetical protein